MKTSRIFLLIVSLLGNSLIAQEKKVMVFGVFDLLHPGHLSFFQQAKIYGDSLIVVVTRDEMVLKLKKKHPVDSEAKRLANVQKIPGIHKAILGDKELGTYAVIKEHKPDIICLGYDQHGLANHLEHVIKTGIIPFIIRQTMQPFEPDIYHTSLLRDQIHRQKEEV